MSIHQQLISASEDGDLEQVKKLIALGADPLCGNGDDCGSLGALLHAIDHKQIPVIEYLLDYVKVPLNDVECMDFSLPRACGTDSLDVVKVILERVPNAELEQEINSVIEEGELSNEIEIYLKSYLIRKLSA